MRARISDVFALDLRSLSLFRIAVAGVLLWDLARRAVDLREMYSDEGMLSIEAARAYHGVWTWSLHLLNGSAAFQSALFVLAAGFAVAMLIGYRTRLAVIASWILLTSLHIRMPLVLNAGDSLLRMLLFWSMFLPLGCRWSVDATRSPDRRHGESIVSPGSVAFILQLCLVYWFTGLMKWNDVWLDGEALSRIFALDIYGKPLGSYLLNYPNLSRGLTWATVTLELVGPTLLLVPWSTRKIRLLVIGAFVAFHLGIECTITVGLFSIVSIAAWLALLPDTFWSHRWLSSLPGRPEADELTRQPLPPSAPSPIWRWTWGFVCVLFLGYVVTWNLAMFGNTPLLNAFQKKTQWLASTTMVRQKWNMFSSPRRFNCWYVYRARLRDGSEVDLLHGGKPTELEKPPRVAATFANHRWRKLHRNLAHKRYAKYRQGVAESVCRRWNRERDDREQVVALEVYCFYQPRGLDFQDGDFTRKLLAQVEVGPPEETGNFAEAVAEMEGNRQLSP